MTTEILDTRTDAQRACFVPVHKLMVHADNVRRTDKRTDIEALATLHRDPLPENVHWTTNKFGLGGFDSDRSVVAAAAAK